MCALEQSRWRNGRQNPGQLRDLRHIALFEERSAFGIEAGRKKIDRNTPDVFAENIRIAHTGQRVIISDEIKRFTFVLKCDCLSHHAEIIADVQNPATAGLNTGKDAHGLERSTLNVQLSTFKSSSDD